MKFIQQRIHKAPSRLALQEIDTPLIVAFLDHLEKRQGLSVRSRNLRLTAIHSFLFNMLLSKRLLIPSKFNVTLPSK